MLCPHTAGPLCSWGEGERDQAPFPLLAKTTALSMEGPLLLTSSFLVKGVFGDLVLSKRGYALGKGMYRWVEVGECMG